jgi:hypothetical protein
MSRHSQQYELRSAVSRDALLPPGHVRTPLNPLLTCFSALVYTSLVVRTYKPVIGNGVFTVIARAADRIEKYQPIGLYKLVRRPDGLLPRQLIR